jgi:hypothetical protein
VTGVEIRRQRTRTCSSGSLPPLQLVRAVSRKAILHKSRMNGSLARDADDEAILKCYTEETRQQFAGVIKSIIESTLTRALTLSGTHGRLGKRDIGAVYPRRAKCTCVGNSGLPGKARRCLGPVALGLLRRRVDRRGAPPRWRVLAGSELLDLTPY